MNPRVEVWTILLAFTALVGISCNGSQPSLSTTSAAVIDVADGAAWAVPDAYEGLCVSPIEIKYVDVQDVKRIGITGVVPEGAIIKGWLQTVPTMYFDVKATVSEGVVIHFNDYPSVDLRIDGDATGSAWLECLPPNVASPGSSSSATEAPERGRLTINGLEGYECYTGNSSAYWDNTRVVLSLRVENFGIARSMKVWLRVTTNSGGPVSKSRGLQNVKFDENTGTYGENDATSITFNGVAIRPGEVKTLRWSADYFWSPDRVSVELWNGEPGLGEGQQGSATYVLSSDSPSAGLRSCARY